MDVGPSTSVGTFQRLLQLRRTAQVGTLNSAALTEIAAQMEESRLPKGTVLLREEQPVQAAFSLVEGEVSVSRGGELIGRVGPGTGLGARGLLLGAPLGVEIVAETDVLALGVDGGHMVTILEDHFELLHEVIKDAAHLNVDLRRRLPGPPALLRETDPRLFASGQMDLRARIMFLRQTGPFAHANIGGIAELAEAMRHVTFKAGVTLWKKGDPALRILLPIKGVIGCAWNRLDGEAVRFHSTLGVPLGSRESVAGVPRWYDATAETPVEAFELTADELIDIFEDNFEMAKDYLETLSRTSLSLIKQGGAPSDLLEFVASHVLPEDLSRLYAADAD